MRLPQGTKDGAVIALATGALGNDAFEFGGHVAQLPDAIANVCQMLARDKVDVAA